MAFFRDAYLGGATRAQPGKLGPSPSIELLLCSLDGKKKAVNDDRFQLSPPPSDWGTQEKNKLEKLTAAGLYLVLAEICSPHHRGRTEPKDGNESVWEGAVSSTYLKSPLVCAITDTYHLTLFCTEF